VKKTPLIVIRYAQLQCNRITWLTVCSECHRYVKCKTVFSLVDKHLIKNHRVSRKNTHPVGQNSFKIEDINEVDWTSHYAKLTFIRPSNVK